MEIGLFWRKWQLFLWANIKSLFNLLVFHVAEVRVFGGKTIDAGDVTPVSFEVASWSNLWRQCGLIYIATWFCTSKQRHSTYVWPRYPWHKQLTSNSSRVVAWRHGGHVSCKHQSKIMTSLTSVVAWRHVMVAVLFSGHIVMSWIWQTQQRESSWRTWYQNQVLSARRQLYRRNHQA